MIRSKLSSYPIGLRRSIYYYAKEKMKTVVHLKINTVAKKQMDESGIEPETFRLRSKRATNYATRPVLLQFWPTAHHAHLNFFVRYTHDYLIVPTNISNNSC